MSNSFSDNIVDTTEALENTAEALENVATATSTLIETDNERKKN